MGPAGVVGVRGEECVEDTSGAGSGSEVGAADIVIWGS